jgi:hypothetical protein
MTPSRLEREHATRDGPMTVASQRVRGTRGPAPAALAVKRLAMIATYLQVIGEADWGVLATQLRTCEVQVTVWSLPQNGSTPGPLRTGLASR